MLDVINTIVPVFLVILLGYFLHVKELLPSPTATVTYVMASEMQGSTGLASAAVTMNTLASCLTFVFWFSFFVQ